MHTGKRMYTDRRILIKVHTYVHRYTCERVCERACVSACVSACLQVCAYRYLQTREFIQAHEYVYWCGLAHNEYSSTVVLGRPNVYHLLTIDILLKAVTGSVGLSPVAGKRLPSAQGQRIQLYIG